MWIFRANVSLEVIFLSRKHVKWKFSILEKLCPLKERGGEGNGTPLQYSCLANPMDGGAWWAAVPEVAKSQTRLSDLTFTFHFHALEKEMATHSSVLAWRIPGTGEPGGLLSMGSHRVGHNCRDLAAAAAMKGTTLQGRLGDQHQVDLAVLQAPDLKSVLIKRFSWMYRWSLGGI